VVPPSAKTAGPRNSETKNRSGRTATGKEGYRKEKRREKELKKADFLRAKQFGCF